MIDAFRIKNFEGSGSLYEMPGSESNIFAFLHESSLRHRAISLPSVNQASHGCLLRFQVSLPSLVEMASVLTISPVWKCSLGPG
jgi:hypothetical protein